MVLLGRVNALPGKCSLGVLGAAPGSSVPLWSPVCLAVASAALSSKNFLMNTMSVAFHILLPGLLRRPRAFGLARLGEPVDAFAASGAKSSASVGTVASVVPIGSLAAPVLSGAAAGATSPTPWGLLLLWRSGCSGAAPRYRMPPEGVVVADPPPHDSSWWGGVPFRW